MLVQSFLCELGFVERAIPYDAFAMLERSETDAVVYDRPLLRYLMN
ncbi:MAG: hypothetical protein KC422_06015 [Trueperaceae bacterium]|nr:hypothetical protein [Trueperaceae bacterium]